MELVFKRTLIMLMLVAAFLVAGLAVTSAGTGQSLGLGSVAYAGEDGDDDEGDGDVSGGGSDVTGSGGGGGDNGGSPAGGVNTGGGGLAGSDPSPWPIALAGLGAVAGGSLLLRRLVKQDG